MKVYGLEMIINEDGNVRMLYDKEGNYFSLWEESKYGGLDRIESIKPNTLRNKMYKDRVVLVRNN